MEQIKLLQEEINTLKSLQTRQLDIASSLGRVEYNLQLLELQKEQIIEDLENLKKEEEKAGAELSKKYGNGSIDIDQGTFTKVN
jgi:archaellum component FlaC